MVYKETNKSYTNFIQTGQKMIGGVMYGPGYTKRLIKHDKETLA